MDSRTCVESKSNRSRIVVVTSVLSGGPAQATILLHSTAVRFDTLKIRVTYPARRSHANQFVY